MMSLLLLAALQDDSQALRDALKASVALGGVEIKASVETEKPEGEMGMMFSVGDESFEGDFTARVDDTGTAHIVADRKERGSIEVFARNGRWVKRATWSGRALPADAFAAEAASLVDLDHLRDQANQFKKVKAGDDDEDCRTFTAELPKEVLQEDKPEQESGGIELMHMGFWKLEKIEAKFWISKADGRVVKIRTALTHGVSESIAVAEDGGGEFDFKDMKNTRVYTIRAEKYDAAMKVELPEEVKKLLAE